MWKKENEDNEPSTPVRRTNSVDQLKDRAIIGGSIAIKGELTGEEDLLIHGRVEGKINLKQHNVTIGEQGKVKADVYGKIISVEGELQGNLFGEEKIIIRQSGIVSGNLTAPRVNLEDGSKFKGSIDMDARSQDKQRNLSETRSEDQVRSVKEKVPFSPQSEVKQSRDVGVGMKAGSSPSNR